MSPEAIAETEAVARFIAQRQWPIRIHATYDETISQLLDIFDRLFSEVRYEARWFIDHAETITTRNIERVKAMGGGMPQPLQQSGRGGLGLPPPESVEC